MYKDEIRNIIKINGYAPILIAKKTFKIFHRNCRDLDRDFREKLIYIFTMEEGSEFEMTEEEFKKFLDEM